MGEPKQNVVLIANRGEVACRVIRTCKKLGLRTVALFTDVDALAPHVRQADVAVALGPNPREYTNKDRLIQVIKEHNVTAVHPGYGFLSENEEFGRAVEACGAAWLGPNPDTLVAFGLKHVARELAESAGVPVAEGSPLLDSSEAAVAAAQKVGYPVLLKATGGGGGLGIFICRNDEDVMNNFNTSQKQGQAFFGNSGVFCEKYIEQAKHIEVQIFGDGHGGCVAMGERECSIQRRHQKVLEETPSPFVTPELRARLQGAAKALGSSAKYRSAGTVEFLVDGLTGHFFFLEVNTRLQVEHGITEFLHGSIDLIEFQMRLQVPGLTPLLSPLEANFPAAHGHSIEVRVCGEDPAKAFQPCPGTLGEVFFPSGEHVRVDTWLETGTEVSPYYDSLLAKVMVWGETREKAIALMEETLAATILKGVPTNIDFLRDLILEPRFKAGDTTTRFLDAFHFVPHVVEVVTPGLQTSVQDWPGRIKLWHVGVPPSGPMDDLALRLANSLVGNADGDAALEFGLSGPTLHFYCDRLVALTGAVFHATLDGEAVPWWSSFLVKAGQTLKVGAVEGDAGVRGYLAVAGGFDVPVYLGSRSTFPGGSFGGYQGRYLKVGDSLPLGKPSSSAHATALPDFLRPTYGGEPAGGVEGHCWSIGVLPGPHADPDYIQAGWMDTFYSTVWKVHYNSNRMGIRLVGPKPEWVRADGGEGGSHPSNVHDHIYAIGTVNFTGDMPVVLAVDGPSLGGFVCASTIVSSELWKMGQVRPGDGIHFQKLEIADAYIKRFVMDATVAAVMKLACGEIQPAQVQAVVEAAAKHTLPAMPAAKPLLKRVEPSGDHPGAEYRLAGDRYLQVEYGPMELDMNLRVRIHELEQALEAAHVAGLVETSPGVRSVMIEYDPRVTQLPQLMAAVEAADASLVAADKMVLPSRILHLPMAFEERWTRDAIDKYMKSVRPEAPYLPSNIQYMAENNGLKDKQEVATAVFDARYLVLGLGDVYLGAPCAVPLNPLHRLVTTKYNPARTFTAEGTVGIGGSYMCIYPMNSPGGYQLVGRTLPIWNTFARVAPFTPTHPWLLEFFDQVRFFLVSEDELELLRHQFASGQYNIKIEQSTFCVHEYNTMIAAMQPQILELKARQRECMVEQLEKEAESQARLAAAEVADGVTAASDALMAADGAEDDAEWDKPGMVKVTAGFTSNVWDVRVKEGQTVAKDDILLVLEAMKMESPVHSPVAGVVRAVKCKPSQLAPTGTLLVVLEETQ